MSSGGSTTVPPPSTSTNSSTGIGVDNINEDIKKGNKNNDGINGADNNVTNKNNIIVVTGSVDKNSGGGGGGTGAQQQQRPEGALTGTGSSTEEGKENSNGNDTKGKDENCDKDKKSGEPEAAKSSGEVANKSSKAEADADNKKKKEQQKEKELKEQKAKQEAAAKEEEEKKKRRERRRLRLSKARGESRERDEIIAPGYGTRRDLFRLAKELSVGGETAFPVEAVEAMMKSRGRGIGTRRSARGGGDGDDAEADDNDNKGAATAAGGGGAGGSAWADFMMEEGVLPDAAPAAESTPTSGKKSMRSSAAAAAAAAASSASVDQLSGKKRVYQFPSEWTEEDQQQRKKMKKGSAKKSFAKTGGASGGLLLQTGTLDTGLVGRKSSKIEFDPELSPYNLLEPTKLPFINATIPIKSIRITKIFTSCNSTHSVAVDQYGTAYGWGRNESKQLSAHISSDDVALPTNLTQAIRQSISSSSSSGTVDLDSVTVKEAAVGKSHTIIRLSDGSLWSCGNNKSGQCGVHRSSTGSSSSDDADIVPQFRKCILSEDMSPVVQMSCGEDFSVILTSDGVMYSTGSAEFGQLGNGETGEHFITANKIAFANCFAFAKRSVFYHAPNEKLHTNSNNNAKVVPMPNNSEIRIQQISCGKHHTLAVEAYSGGDPNHKCRVFSWGCGDYGCLGHGVQSDEYYPRLIGSLYANPSYGADDDKLRVAAGSHCSLLRTKLGHVYYWGKHRMVGEAVMRPQLVDVLANNQHHVHQISAGYQTVFCSTMASQTVAWGQGPHGELGLGAGANKSSSKPTFVDALHGRRVLSVSCGYGHTLFVVRDPDDSDDDGDNEGQRTSNEAKVEGELPEIDDPDDLVEKLEAAVRERAKASSSSSAAKGKGKKGGGGKKR